jgi:asparagine synthase (glutamine-hydrolysing)
MCGIAGYWTPGGFASVEAGRVLTAMTERIRTRGPDDEGSWLDPAHGIALGHRRLSVVDLSEAGHQPMLSADGRYVMVFNGEIYNHHEMRSQLAGEQWRGHSDTETLLAAISAWGLQACLEKAVGMFALAVWDRAQRTLSFARDRMGEKPLYFGWQSGTCYFASELKALKAHPDFKPEVDRNALGSLVRKGYIAAPQSVYQGISKLLPGCFVTFNAAGHPQGADGIKPYWSLRQAVAQGQAKPFTGTPAQAVDELERLLKQAVQGQMMADVPLGAFLSGGIDSSTIVALMQSQSGRPVKTYTIGFDDPLYNEAEHAQAVARHLGTEHTEYQATAQDALQLVGHLPDIYDEPFADMSQIPTLLVSQLARRSVTVALSGDGGDELFCGYGRYPQAQEAWRKLRRVPLVLRRAIKPMLPRGVLKAGIDAPDVDAFYRFMNTQWKEYPGLVLGEGAQDGGRSFPPGLDAMSRMMYADMGDYLPDDILVKVDRAAMHHSLETRVPMLDHRIVEFAWQLPTQLKRQEGVGKWPLRQVLYRHVPAELVDRPKRGFAVPMHKWLRTELREWAEEMLSEQRLRSEGFFDVQAVRTEWQMHLDGRKDRHYALWAVLMFQQWNKDARKVEGGVF